MVSTYYLDPVGRGYYTVVIHRSLLPYLPYLFPYLLSDFTHASGTRELDYLFPSPTNEITYFGLVTRELDYLFPGTTE